MLSEVQRFQNLPQFSHEPLEVNLIRHGLSAGNLFKQLLNTGKLPPEKAAKLMDLIRIDWDIPLVRKGHEQAKQLGLKLKADPFFDPKSIDVVVVANCRRARETAYGVMDAAGIDPKLIIELNPRIGERDWGDHHLQDKDLIARAEKLRIEDPFCWSPHEGEKMRYTSERVNHAFTTFNRRFGGKRVLGFTHGEFIVSAKAEISRIYDPLDFSELLKQGIPNCGLLQISRLSPEGKESNGYTHLRQFAVESSARQGDWSGKWQEIIRPKYDLSNIVAPPTDRSKEILELLGEYLP